MKILKTLVFMLVFGAFGANADGKLFKCPSRCVSQFQKNAANTMLIYPAYQQFWYTDGAPQSTLELAQGGTIYQYDFVIDRNSGYLYRVMNAGTFDSQTQTYTNLSFELVATQSSINTVLYKAQGNATLSLGTVYVSYSGLASGDKIQLVYKTPSGTPGALYISDVDVGQGFRINSTSALDASTVSYSILN